MPRHVFDLLVVVNPGAGGCQGFVIDIRGQQAKREITDLLEFGHHDRQGIGFFTCGTGRAPDADFRAGASGSMANPVVNETGQDFEVLGFAKEMGGVGGHGADKEVGHAQVPGIDRFDEVAVGRDPFLLELEQTARHQGQILFVHGQVNPSQPPQGGGKFQELPL